MSRRGGVWPVAVPQFRSLDQLSGELAARPSKFFAALDDADKQAADTELAREAFAAAVGFYDCPCGSEFEFADDSSLEEYAALNRWLGRHVPCSEVEAERLARDNEMLVRQNEALLCRVAELQAEDDAKAETIGDLNARVLRMAGELAEARRQRDWEFSP